MKNYKPKLEIKVSKVNKLKVYFINLSYEISGNYEKVSLYCHEVISRMSKLKKKKKAR